jgi:hypothetical protein
MTAAAQQVPQAAHREIDIGEITMKIVGSGSLANLPAFKSRLAVTLFLSGIVGGTAALADDDDFDLRPGNLLVSRAVYDNNSQNVVAGTTLLPPNCVAPHCVTATDGGSYPNVWNNSFADLSFGITAKIVLDQLKPSGGLINSLEVPNSSQRRISAGKDQMVTSFSRGRELHGNSNGALW